MCNEMNWQRCWLAFDIKIILKMLFINYIRANKVCSYSRCPHNYDVMTLYVI